MDFIKSWNIFIDDFIHNEGYKDIFDGLANTLKIAFFGLIIGIIIGTFIAVIKVAPKYHLFTKILDKICTIYTEFFRGIPIVVLLLIGWFVIVLPLSKGSADKITFCIIIFGLNSGAYVSEIMRGGLNSVDKGQMEAGRALGLTYTTTMLKFIIPQAAKNIVPTLGNELITLVKETSVIYMIGGHDLAYIFKSAADNNYNYLVPYLVMGFIYLIIVIVLSVIIKLVERYFTKSDRRKTGGAKNGKRSKASTK